MSKAIELLQRHSIRASYQRLTVLNYMLEHRVHATADEIYDGLRSEMPVLSRTTVYNTLRLFKEKGVVEALGLDDVSMHYDVCTEPHAHFHCSRCGVITDVDIPAEEWERMLAFGKGAPHMLLTYTGLCDRCRHQQTTDN